MFALSSKLKRTRTENLHVRNDVAQINQLPEVPKVLNRFLLSSCTMTPEVCHSLCRLRHSRTPVAGRMRTHWHVPRFDPTGTLGVAVPLYRHQRMGLDSLFPSAGTDWIQLCKNTTEQHRWTSQNRVSFHRTWIYEPRDQIVSVDHRLRMTPFPSYGESADIGTDRVA